jgi:hypothetical protein
MAGIVRTTLFVGVAIVILIGLRIWWTDQAKSVTLPNGFILSGENLVSPDRKTILATDLEFICFDDRFLSASSRQPGQSGLFDGLTGARTSSDDHPEIYQPGGLKQGGQGCNGYYTWLIGPNLLMDGNHAPFLPPCLSVNRANPALKDKAWLDRPCDNR